MQNFEPWFRELYPHLRDEELGMAWKRFQAYCNLMARIWNRIEMDREAGARPMDEINS